MCFDAHLVLHMIQIIVIVLVITHCCEIVLTAVNLITTNVDAAMTTKLDVTLVTDMDIKVGCAL